MRRSPLALLLIPALAACSTEQVVGNTVDVAAGATELVVRGAVGATKLAARGTVAGVRRLNEAQGGRAAGTLVCVDGEGRVVGTVTREGGQAVCTLDPAA